MISKKSGLILGAVLLLALPLAVWLIGPGLLPGYRGDAIKKLTGSLLPAKENLPELADLGDLIFRNYEEYRANTLRWSAAYFGCLFGAAFLSACSGVLLKLECFNKYPKLKSDLPAIMSALAALLITLLTIGSFEEKWRSNRIAASRMENLAYDLLKSDASKSDASMASEKDKILSKIQAINEAHTSGIVGKNSKESVSNLD
jgi:hypothetical protein